jgi:hypothetical protein
MMTREKVIDLYFMEARAKLIDLAAFFDRVERAPGDDDFRVKALRKAVAEMTSDEKGRARSVLLSLSDPSVEPAATAAGKGASGAWNGNAA